MKFRIDMKDPDGVHDSLEHAVKESLAAVEGIDDEEREILKDQRRDTFKMTMAKFFKYGEYLSVEIDTEAGTCTVLPAGR